MRKKGRVISQLVLILTPLVLVFAFIATLPFITSSQNQTGQFKTENFNNQKISLSNGEYISPVFNLENSTNSIGLKYDLLNPDIEPIIYLRALQPDGWTGWLEVEEKDRDEIPNNKTNRVEKDLSQGVKYSDLIFLNEASKVQYRTTLKANFNGQVFQELKLIAIGQEELDLFSRLRNKLSSILIKEASSNVNVIDRADWVARKADGSRKNWVKNRYVYNNWPLKYRDPNKIIIHHAGSLSGYIPKTQAKAKTFLQNIHYYHAKIVNGGWGDIGYNYIIDSWGNIYHGRLGSNGVIGGHTYSQNDGSIGILLLGSYERYCMKSVSGTKDKIVGENYCKNKITGYYWRKNRPTDKMLNALAEFSGYKAYQNKINVSKNLLGHKDYANNPPGRNFTACPGRFAYRKLDYVRKSASTYKQAYSGDWPENSLLSPTNSGTIYIIKNSKRLAILSKDVFNQWGYKKSKIKQLPGDTIKEIPYGGLLVYKQGTLIKADGKGTIWVIDNGKRKYINSYSVLQTKGWTDRNIRSITLKKLKKIPYGGKYLTNNNQSNDKIESGDKSTPVNYQSGDLIRRSSGGTVYRIKKDGNIKRPILSPDVFRTYRIPTGEMIVYKSGTLISTKNSGTIWVIDRPYRMAISTINQLRQFSSINKVKILNSKKLNRIPYGGLY